MSTVIGVDFTESDQGKVVTFDPGAKRRCTGHDSDGERCITILNRFNPGPECLRHAAERQTRRVNADGLNPFPARFLEAA